MHILVTRPEADGLAMQAQLSALDITATLAPTLDLKFQDCAGIDLSGTQAVAITSRNALKGIAHNNLIDALAAHDVYAVGAATAEFANSLGLASVTTGPGTAKALAAQIAAERDTNAGAIHHIRGEHVAFDFRSALEDEGFVVEETIAYRAEPTAQFPPAAVAALRENRISGVILMSARSAASFADLLQHHDLIRHAAAVHYFCLSPLVRDSLLSSLPHIEHNTISVPNQPNTEELLALIARFAANSRQIQ